MTTRSTKGDITLPTIKEEQISHKETGQTHEASRISNSNTTQHKGIINRATNHLRGTKPQINTNNPKQTAITTTTITGPSPQISEMVTETLKNIKETTHSLDLRDQTTTMVVTGIKLRAGSEMQ